jgi:hypothetical protein
MYPLRQRSKRVGPQLGRVVDSRMVSELPLADTQLHSNSVRYPPGTAVSHSLTTLP